MKLTKNIIKEMIRYELKEGKLTEFNDIPRWKVYIDDEKEPLTILGKGIMHVKKTVHAMVSPAKITIRKIVREGKLTEAEKSISFKLGGVTFGKDYQGLKSQNGGIRYYYQKGTGSKNMESDFGKFIVKVGGLVSSSDKNKVAKKLKEGKLTESKKIKYNKNDWKKINKIAKKKTVMIQTAFGDEFKWEDGSSHGVFGSENNGREIELTHDDIDVVIVEGIKKLNEGPAYEYAKHRKNIERSWDIVDKSVMNFVKELKQKGFKDEAFTIQKKFQASYRNFDHYFEIEMKKLL